MKKVESSMLNCSMKKFMAASWLIFFSLFLGNTYAWQEIDHDDIEPAIEGVLENFEGEAIDSLGYGLHTVWFYTEADCDTISITLGGVTNDYYLKCGYKVGFGNVPSGTYYNVVEGCGGKATGYINVDRDLNIVICPKIDFAHLDCCPKGVESGGRYFCNECPKSPSPTSTTIVPITSTTTTSVPITSTTSTSSTSTTTIPEYIHSLDGTLWIRDILDDHIGFCNGEFYYDYNSFSERWEPYPGIPFYIDIDKTVYFAFIGALTAYTGFGNAEVGNGFMLSWVILPISNGFIPLPLFVSINLVSDEWTPDIAPPNTSKTTIN